MLRRDELQKIVGKSYTLIEICGKGNYGEVWKANDNNMEREVAIKFLHPYLPKDIIFSEAKKQSTVESPYIVTIYTCDQKGFIILEYCPSSLEKRMKENIKLKKKFSKEDILSITSSCIEGLDEAHRKNIIHGDIKPGNVLIDKRGIYKISDFGVAISIGKSSNYIRLGSTKWQPPEMYEEYLEESRIFDQSRDYFSLGIIIYLLYTNRHPYHYEDPSSLFSERDNILDHEFKVISPKYYDQEIPPATESIILDLLSKEKVSRVRAFEKAKIHFSEFPITEQTLCSKCGVASPQNKKYCGECGNILISTEDISNREIQENIQFAKERFFIQFLPNEALKILEATITKYGSKKVSSIADCYSLAAFIKNSQHLYSEAERISNEGLSIYLNHVNLLHGRGYSRYRQGKTKEAIEDLKIALKLAKEDKKIQQIQRLLEEIDSASSRVAY